MEYLKIGIILTAVTANFSLGLLVLNKNSKNIVNLTLVGFAWTFAIWSLSLFFYDYPIIFSSLFWIKITYVVVILGIIGFLYYFGYIFPDGKKPPMVGQVIFFIFALLLVSSLFFTNQFVQDVVEVNNGKQTLLGQIYPLFIIFDSIFGFWGLGMLIKKYLSARGTIRGQLKYIFLGLTLFVITVLVLDAIIPLMTGNSAYFSISTVGSLFFVGLTAYAVIKHHLLDIRIAMQEVMAHVLTAIIIGVISYVGAVIYWLTTGLPFKYSVILVTLAVGVLLSLFFHRVAIFSKLVVSSLIRQPFYDFEKTVLDISLTLASSLELNKLIDVICFNLIKYLGVGDVAVVFRDVNYRDSKKVGFSNGLTFLEDNSLLSYITKYKKTIILEEIGSLISELNDEGEKFKLRQLYTHMEHTGVALVIPWVSSEKLLGLLILGNKKSGDPFTVQDIDLLNTISFQSLNAVENAISYEKIKRFNVTLSEEITKATIELQEANTRLKKLDQIKNDFVSIVSHELRTPMTAIRSYAWMALHRSDMPLSANLEKYITRILMSTEHLITLVNDMLNISRIESGRIEINPESIDLYALVKDIIDEVYFSKSEEKNIQFVVLEKPVPKVFADPEKLRQVLLNLVGNSLKFTPDGGKIVFDFFSDGKTVEASVSDTGVGISREDISKLFHKFSRLNNSYTAAATSGGTGLGLYISKNLVELMHGKIWMTSKGLNQGTTVTVALPIASADVLREAEKYTVKPQGEVKTLEPVAI